MMAAGGIIENAQGSIDLMGLVGRFTGGGRRAAPASQPQPAAATQAARRRCRRPVKAPDPGPGREGCFWRWCRWVWPPRLSRRRASATSRRAGAAPQPAVASRRRARAADAPAGGARRRRKGGTELMLRGLDKITGRPTDIAAPDRQAGAVRHPHHHGALCYSTPPARRRKPRPLCRSRITAPTSRRGEFSPAGCMAPAPASTAWSIRSMMCG